MLPIRKILIPTDFSGPSGYAFQLACSLARENGAQLLVLHVVPPAVVMYGPPTAEYLGNLRQELCLLKPSDPQTCTEHLLAEGNPAAAILRAAQENNCDVIVMGTHGRTGLNRFLMGSVAEEVVRKAPCPVVTVRVPARCNPA